MAGLFAKAAAKAADKAAAKPKKKETVWAVGPADAGLGKAVKDYVRIENEIKALETKANVLKGLIKDEGSSRFVQDYAELGVHPETPMRLMNDEGESATFVVQDRGSQYGLKEGQIEQLIGLLGEDAAKNEIYEETTFAFNREVLAVPGVLEEIGKALERAQKKLVESEVLKEEQAELLLDAKTKTAFKPGVLQRLGMICGRDVVRMESFLEIAGSSITRYAKS
jgi:hypothetical protein